MGCLVALQDDMDGFLADHPMIDHWQCQLSVDCRSLEALTNYIEAERQGVEELNAEDDCREGHGCDALAEIQREHYEHPNAIRDGALSIVDRVRRAVEGQ